MTPELPFTGFHELIEIPLSSSDQRSLSLLKRLFIEEKPDPGRPFSFLLEKLTGKVFDIDQATTCWKKILKHKIVLQQKLGRSVGIQTAAIDFFEHQSPDATLFNPSQHQPALGMPRSEEENTSVYFKSYQPEKLKIELLRAKRYRHALSAIMLDIDNFSDINETLTYKEGDRVLTTIVNIIKKTIRNVDNLDRLSGDRFFLILPNTNGREARALAERIRINIFNRTSRLSPFSEGITATLSVGQCSHATSSTEFIRRLEFALEEGKNKKNNTVFTTF